MSVWDVYQSRANARGDTKRATQLKREIRTINDRLPDSLSYQEVVIHNAEHGYNIASEEILQHAVTKSVAVINSDNLNEKTIIALPGDDIENGSLVAWMDNYWLVTERDANTTVYTRAKMIQCNHLLRWVSDEDKICEQWCIIEDGTKLKRNIMRNSLVCWKQYAKRISLIAGNPLEPYSLQRGFETKASAIA